MARELTEKQKAFLDVLFSDEAKGDVVKAKVLAGYSPDYSTTQLVASLRNEIIEATNQFLARVAPKAVMSIAGVLDNPTELGLSYKIAAAKDLLDRAGVVKTERIEVSNGLFILPPKEKEDG